VPYQVVVPVTDNAARVRELLLPRENQDVVHQYMQLTEDCTTCLQVHHVIDKGGSTTSASPGLLFKDMGVVIMGRCLLVKTRQMVQKYTREFLTTPDDFQDDDVHVLLRNKNYIKFVSARAAEKYHEEEEVSLRVNLLPFTFYLFPFSFFLLQFFPGIHTYIHTTRLPVVVCSLFVLFRTHSGGGVGFQDVR